MKLAYPVSGLLLLAWPLLGEKAASPNVYNLPGTATAVAPNEAEHAADQDAAHQDARQYARKPRVTEAAGEVTIQVPVDTEQ